ncbi:MAG: 3',5'-cyclic nucleotide phosphodiesterase, partial [Alphaproteobacteria bacterium]|nr:3',5'-cyclic nucleotide phosphodiesterase [Alphaproteobacteria bacterium]
MTGPLPPLSVRTAQEISRALKSGSSLAHDPRLANTLQEVQEMDRRFHKRGDIFFHSGGTAFETAQRFTQIHVDFYRQAGRPSLPMLAVYHAEKLGLDKNSPEYRAMILVAVRAEMQAEPAPDYHNRFHFTDVAAVTANLLEQNNQITAAGAVQLTKEEQALAFVAAIGHDLDHDGSSNPANDPLLNENKSFVLMAPLLREAGLSQADIARIHIILMTTSPNGPHTILKAIAHAQREGRAAAFDHLKDAAKFPDLKALAGDAKLTQMAAIVSDADLYASSGAGPKSNKVMSELLTRENRKHGGTADFTNDNARLFCLDSIVGKEGFASAPGRAAANDNLESL